MCTGLHLVSLEKERSVSQLGPGAQCITFLSGLQASVVVAKNLLTDDHLCRIMATEYLVLSLVRALCCIAIPRHCLASRAGAVNCIPSQRQIDRVGGLAHQDLFNRIVLW